MPDARTIHDFDQFNADIQAMAKHVATYRKELIAGGVSEVDAWAAAQRVEEKYSSYLFARMEAKKQSEEFRALEAGIRLLDELMQRRGLISDNEPL